MRKILIVLFILFSLKGISQPTTDFPLLGNPRSNAVTRGWHTVDSGFAITNIIKDTLVAPFRIGELRIRSQDSTFYVGISLSAAQKWRKIGGGGSGAFLKTSTSITPINNAGYVNINTINNSELPQYSFTGKWDSAAFNIRAQGNFDGAPVANDDDSVIYVLGGALNGNAANSTDSIYKSLNGGTTFVPHTLKLPYPSHTFGFVKTDDNDFIMVGGDIVNSNTERRTVSLTRHFTSWTTQTTTAAFGPRFLNATVWHEGRIFVIGGQSNVVGGRDSSIYVSKDKGVTWTQVNINLDSMKFIAANLNGCAQSWNGRIWIVSGGLYDTTTAGGSHFTYSRRTYSGEYDSTTNTISFRREQDILPTLGVQYPTTFVWDGKLWFGFGNNAAYGNSDTLMFMDKTQTWHYFNPSPFLHPRTHAAKVAIYKNNVVRVWGNNLNNCYILSRDGQLVDTSSSKRLAYYSAFGRTISGSVIASFPSGQQNLLVEKSSTSSNDADIPSVTASNPNTGATSFAELRAKVGGGYASANPETWLYAAKSGGSNYGALATVSNHELRFYTNSTSLIMTMKTNGDVVLNSFAGLGTKFLQIDNTGKFGATVNVSDVVTKVATPVNDQIGVWTGSGTLEGDANLTWSGSGISVQGTETLKYTTTAVGLTLGTHRFLEVTATGQTITLPTAVGVSGRLYTVKLTASGSCTVNTTSSQTIDGSTTYSLSAQYKYVTVLSNGANWIIVANN